jgi:hypothetical protein
MLQQWYVVGVVTTMIQDYLVRYSRDVSSIRPYRLGIA